MLLRQKLQSFLCSSLGSPRMPLLLLCWSNSSLRLSPDRKGRPRLHLSMGGVARRRESTTVPLCPHFTDEETYPERFGGVLKVT